jgi:protein TonB
VHATLFGLIVLFVAPPLKPNSKWVLAYLVELGNGGAGGRAGSTITIDATAPPARGSNVIASSPKPASRRPASLHARRKLTVIRESAAPAADVASDASLVSSTPRQASQAVSSGDSMDHGNSPRGTGSGAIGSGSGTGDGSGFEAGVIVAHAEYGMNPAPKYPARARRREQQGTVILRVQVGADGSVMRVEVAESSGYTALDDAALQSVRARWRFVPARRGGVPFESWVLVPIRFALTEANASR